MDTIVKRLLENHRVDEGASIDFNQLLGEIKDQVRKTMMSPRFGFDSDDVEKYSKVELKDEGDAIVLEVRGEFSYEGMEEMADVLNPIVAKYDKDAYFDFEDAGILVAYFEK